MTAMTIAQLSPSYGTRQAVKSVDMVIAAQKITAIIGPSGCGKSTVLRCLNRMHETITGARVTGTVYLGNQDIYAPDTDPTLLRRRVGMVFQQPVAFRTRNVYENVAVGLRLQGMNAKADLDVAVEAALRDAVLWDEVKDVLDKPGTALSGGQQQRLAIARTLAIKPDVILLDEPSEGIMPVLVDEMFELFAKLKQQGLTILLVEQNVQQALKISDRAYILDQGEIVFHDTAQNLLNNDEIQQKYCAV